MAKTTHWTNIVFFILICHVFYGCTTLDYSHNTSCYRPPLPVLNKVKVAIVLGGGGAKGLAHVGVLEELLSAGIYPDLIVGCSAGSIVGVLFADSSNIYHVKNLLFQKRREHFLDLSLEHAPFGFSNAAAMRLFLTTHLHAKRFEELKIPFVAVATSLEFGDLVPFGTGELESPVRASAAIPGVYLPVKINGSYFIDGAVADPVPVQVARSLGAEFIIAVDLSGTLPKTLPNHIFGILERSLEIHYLHHSRMVCQNADYVIKVPFDGIGTFEDGQNEKIYEIGRTIAKQAVPMIKQKLKNIKDQY
jgi:NTE family protein